MSDEKDIDLYIKMTRLEAKVEVIEKQNEKIEKLVESNYTLSNSIEALASQVATYDKKTEMLIKRMEDAKSEVDERIGNDEQRIDTIEHDVSNLNESSASTKTSIDKVLKQQEEINLKGYKWFKSFFTQFKDKSQAALIAAVVAGAGYVVLHIIEYIAKLLLTK